MSKKDLSSFSSALKKLDALNARRTTASPNLEGILNLTTNDSLGIASDLEKRRAFLEKALKSNDMLLGSRASRLLTGTSKYHEALEKLLSQKLGKEATLLAPSGWHANTSLGPALSSINPSKTLFIADNEIHASLVDGFKMAAALGAGFTRFKHNDASHLEKLIKTHEKDFEQIFVVTESLYSMDGDWAPMTDIAAIRNENPKVMWILDEAHAFVSYGFSGLGWAEETQTLDKVDIFVGTCGKGFGGHGAFISTYSEIREWLVSAARPLIYTTALSPLDVAWLLDTLYSLDELKAKRERLKEIINKVHDFLQTPKDFPRSHIIPLIAKESEIALSWSNKLLERGILVGAIRPPTVAKGTSRLRLSLSADMTEEAIEKLFTALTETGILEAVRKNWGK